MTNIDSPEWRFHRLWSDAQTAVGGLIRSLVQDPHLADDLLQETALACFRYFDRYDPERPFVAWALTVAKNKVRDAWRRQQRQPAVLMDDQVLDHLVTLSARQQPVYDERRQAMEQCLRGLEGRGRQILEAFYHHGQSAMRIAEQMGLKPEHVRVLLGRARQAVRRCAEKRLAAS